MKSRNVTTQYTMRAMRRIPGSRARWKTCIMAMIDLVAAERVSKSRLEDITRLHQDEFIRRRLPERPAADLPSLSLADSLHDALAPLLRVP
jgi:hypothetical protein